MAVWSGRFAHSMSHVMQALNHSLTTDIRLLPFDLQVDRVWVGELARLKVVTAAERAAIEQAIDTITTECSADAFTAQVASLPDEDVHSYVERRLVELAGTAGAKIHTGRSRNDLVLTDLRLYLKAVLRALDQTLSRLILTTTARAQEHKTVILPGYTHVQQAQPISLAHYLLSLSTVLRDDVLRFESILERVDYCPLGSGALAGSAYPIDREAIAQALGFRAPTPNSLAAVSMRDECLEVASACAILMTHLSRYAEDWIMWSGQEFGFVELADTVTTGSSLMPQKKNPDSLELIRGKTARVIGQMQTLFTLMKGLPLTYARDMQEDKPALFDALDQTLLCCVVFEEVVRTMVFKPERMFLALDSNLFATEVADYLVGKDVPFRVAHEIVGHLVRECLAQEKNLAKLSHKELAALVPAAHRDHAKAFAADVSRCFDPETALARRNLTGGTGPKSVEAQIQALETWLKARLAG